MKPNIVPNCIRSENYMITFEVEEEKYVWIFNKKRVSLFYIFILIQLNKLYISRFPLFGKKYQLKFASDPSAETHCLVHFPSFIRFIYILSYILVLDFVQSYKLP